MKNSEALDKCALIATLKLFSAKWKPCILSQLMVKERRYSQLTKLIPNITKKMLTAHLKDLEKDGLVNREVLLTVPPQVTYSLTKKGESLKNLFQATSDWGVRNIENVVPMDKMLNSNYKK